MSIDSIITIYDHSGGLIVIGSSSWAVSLLWSDSGQFPRIHQCQGLQPHQLTSSKPCEFQSEYNFRSVENKQNNICTKVYCCIQFSSFFLWREAEITIKQPTNPTRLSAAKPTEKQTFVWRAHSSVLKTQRHKGTIFPGLLPIDHSGSDSRNNLRYLCVTINWRYVWCWLVYCISVCELFAGHRVNSCW